MAGAGASSRVSSMSSGGTGSMMGGSIRLINGCVDMQQCEELLEVHESGAFKEVFCTWK